MLRAEFWMTGTRYCYAVLLKLRWVGAIIVLCLSWTLAALPANAANPVDAKLREQVLQIIRENPEAILQSVGEYQQKQQQAQQRDREAFLQTLKTSPQTAIGQSPTKGATNGKVLLIEFSDFQCPFCAQARDSLQQLTAKYPNLVTLAYKHFPLVAIHAEALPAAKAAWAAGQQGKFWEYHDALFAQQAQLGPELYLETAKTLNLDMARFERDRASAAANTAIEQDTQLAEGLGLQGTPFFIVSSDAFSGAAQLSDLEQIMTQVSQSTNS